MRWGRIRGRSILRVVSFCGSSLIQNPGDGEGGGEEFVVRAANLRPNEKFARDRTKEKGNPSLPDGPRQPLLGCQKEESAVFEEDGKHLNRWENTKVITSTLETASACAEKKSVNNPDWEGRSSIPRNSSLKRGGEGGVMHLIPRTCRLGGYRTREKKEGGRFNDCAGRGWEPTKRSQERRGT